MNTFAFRASFVTAACLLVATPAFAQSLSTPHAPTGVAPSAKKEEPPAPVLPGSRTEATAVAPASRSALDMAPTEALFDAINRGDLAAAKDALNRGADLNGHNVLGLTPLDLAVDLGRNEITFALLSMRGGSPSPSEPSVVTASAAPPKGQAAKRQAASRHAPRQDVTVRQAGYSSAQRGAAQQAPRLFAGDGGTPIPRAGFLGFDASR